MERVSQKKKFLLSKELSLWSKLKFFNSYISATWWCKLLIFQTLVIYSNLYLRTTTLGCTDIGIWKSEFVATTQFLFKRTYFIFIYECKSCFKVNLLNLDLKTKHIPVVLPCSPIFQGVHDRDYLNIQR